MKGSIRVGPPRIAVRLDALIHDFRGMSIGKADVRRHALDAGFRRAEGAGCTVVVVNRIGGSGAKVIVPNNRLGFNKPILGGRVFDAGCVQSPCVAADGWAVIPELGAGRIAQAFDATDAHAGDANGIGTSRRLAKIDVGAGRAVENRRMQIARKRGKTRVIGRGRNAEIWSDLMRVEKAVVPSAHVPVVLTG